MRGRLTPNASESASHSATLFPLMTCTNADPSQSRRPSRFSSSVIALRRIVLTRGDSVYLAGMARSPTDVALYIGALRESVAFANHAMVPVRVSETEDEEQYRVEVGARAGAD